MFGENVSVTSFRRMFVIVILLIVCMESVGAVTLISSCTVISSPGGYVLTQNIINSTVDDACIKINSNDVVFDGAGYTIDGVDTPFNDGIVVHNGLVTLTNVTVENVTLTDWDYGIIYKNVSNGIISSVTVSSNNEGFVLKFSNSNNLTDNTAYNNSINGILLNISNSNNIIGNTANSNQFGIDLLSSNNNKLINNIANSNHIIPGRYIALGILLGLSNNNTLSGNTASNNWGGISVSYYCNNNTLIGNTANNNTRDGFNLDSYSNNNMINGNIASNNTNGIEVWDSINNSIYNNHFNNANNFLISNSTNNWNATKIAGTNIVGGSYLGGNFWAKPDGTGFSQTCTDADSDGICDSPKVLDSNNTDLLPLSFNITSSNYTISGWVVNNTGHPISSVAIRIQGIDTDEISFNRYVYTNASGYYFIELPNNHSWHDVNVDGYSLNNYGQSKLIYGRSDTDSLETLTLNFTMPAAEISPAGMWEGNITTLNITVYDPALVDNNKVWFQTRLKNGESYSPEFIDSLVTSVSGEWMETDRGMSWTQINLTKIENHWEGSIDIRPYYDINDFQLNFQGGLHRFSYWGVNEVSVSESNLTILDGDYPTIISVDSPDTIQVGINATFNASKTIDPDNNITSYRWDFGNDGTWDENGAIVSYQFTTGGNNQVKLEVTNDDGKVVQHDFDITVIETISPTNNVCAALCHIYNKYLNKSVDFYPNTETSFDEYETFIGFLNEMEDTPMNVTDPTIDFYYNTSELYGNSYDFFGDVLPTLLEEGHAFFEFEDIILSDSKVTYGIDKGERIDSTGFSVLRDVENGGIVTEDGYLNVTVSAVLDEGVNGFISLDSWLGNSSEFNAWVVNWSTNEQFDGNNTGSNHVSVNFDTWDETPPHEYNLTITFYVDKIIPANITIKPGVSVSTRENLQTIEEVIGSNITINGTMFNMNATFNSSNHNLTWRGEEAFEKRVELQGGGAKVLEPYAVFKLDKKYVVETDSNSLSSGNYEHDLRYRIGIDNKYDASHTVLGNLNFSVNVDNISNIDWYQYAIWDKTTVDWEFPLDYEINEYKNHEVGFDTNFSESRYMNVNINRWMNQTEFSSDGYQLAKFNVTFKDKNFDFVWANIEPFDYYNGFGIDASIVPDTFTNDNNAPGEFTEEENGVHFDFDKEQLQTNVTYNFSVIIKINLTGERTPPVHFKPEFVIGEGLYYNSAYETGYNVEVPSLLLPEDISNVSASTNISNVWKIERFDHAVAWLRDDVTPPIITNFIVSPNTSVSTVNPAIASAYVNDDNLRRVEFNVVDSNNLLDTNQTIFAIYGNESGISGQYVSQSWDAKSWNITNGTVQDNVFAIFQADVQDHIIVPVLFRKNETTSWQEALLWFNITSGNLSQITSQSDGTLLTLDNGISIINIKKWKFVKGLDYPPEPVEGKTFVLYSIGSPNNPNLISSPVPAGSYKLSVHAEDIMRNDNGMFVNVTVTPTSQTTLTVDDSGGADYTTIQAAIDAAITGDTIYVYNGSYMENVKVNKQVTLQGESAGVVIVIAASTSDHVFEVTADYVNISGFKVTGATGSSRAGINSYGNHGNISDNNATGNNWGIYLQSSSNYNTLTNNTVNSNGGYGIILYSSSNNTLTNNTANSNDNHGIILSSSSNNTLTNNNANSNKNGIHLLSSSNYNNLTSNTANSNVNYGIYLYSSSNNIIYNNYFNNTNNTNNTNNAYNDGNHVWNITKTTGINIIGGSYLAGNYWAHPNGTGFSEICTDADSDGICDSSYTLRFGNIDYLPLVKVTGQDFTPPASITNLNYMAGTTWINWTWDNPADSDFSEVMVYLNGTFITNITAPQNYYNTTGLLPDTSYELSTHTVDTAGNVNQTWVNLTAITSSVGIKGDFNNNGRVDIGDVAKVAYMVVGKVSDDLSADFNENQKIDIGDAAKIAYYLVGKVGIL